MVKNLILKSCYKEFVRNMPIFCLEGVVENRKRFIFLKRKKPPAKDQWWFPGGRLFFNEDFIPAVQRILKKELGIRKIKIIKFLGLGGTRFKKGYFNLPSHTVNYIFFVKIDDNQAKNIKLDKVNHFDYKWLANIPKQSHSHLKKFLKLAGFK